MLNNFGFGAMGIFEGLTPVEHTSSKHAANTSEKGNKKSNPKPKAPVITQYHVPAQFFFDSYPPVEITEAGEFTSKEIFEKLSELTGINLFQEHAEEFLLTKLSDNSYLVRPSFASHVEKGNAGCRLLLDSLLDSIPENSNNNDVKESEEDKKKIDKVAQIKAYVQNTYGITVEVHLLGDTYIPVPISPSSGSEKNLHFPIKICCLRVPMELLILNDAVISEETYISEDSNVFTAITKKGIEKSILSLYPEYSNDLTIGIDEKNNAVQVMHKPPYNAISNNTKEQETYPSDATISLVFTKLQLSPDLFKGNSSVTKKEIIKYLGKTYPEYSLERTELIYDKKNNIIMPILKSGKRGAYTLDEGEQYRHESSDLLDITASKLESPDSWGCVSGSAQLKYPKIPFFILKEVVDFFWDAFTLYRSEAIALIYFRKSTGNYQVFIPSQVVTESSVSFNRDFELECDPDFVLALEIHSHGTYPAFWSTTDNEDELSHRLYAVVGDLSSFRYDSKHIRVRAATGIYHVQCSLWDIFENPISIDAINPKLGRLKIEINPTR